MDRILRDAAEQRKTETNRVGQLRTFQDRISSEETSFWQIAAVRDTFAEMSEVSCHKCCQARGGWSRVECFICFMFLGNVGITTINHP